ncbi:MAG TPA: glycoside hydrolase family 97 catalytic domain-containing protein [Phnomibacter sp.]|nr:glycoside hydrolase family 97 catalytic domain-containing protein [Phnomibacter sp.]
MRLLSFICTFFCLGFGAQLHAQQPVSSPDNSIMVEVHLAEQGSIRYSVKVTGQTILLPSTLGLQKGNKDLGKGFTILEQTPVIPIEDKYELVHGKKRQVSYKARTSIFSFRHAGGDLLKVIFRVSNDGVAFRYQLISSKDEIVNITAEFTSFRFPMATKSWLQPMQVSKTGWEQTNPAYEEHYVQAAPVGTPSPAPAGWVYPALFNHGDTWVLLTEAAVGPDDCATRLKAASPDGEYFVGYPDEREVITGKGLLPIAGKEYVSPWRVITIGSLGTMVESTHGTDLADPSGVKDVSFVKPGGASWSWINSKDDLITYDEQKKYIDFAADMHWPYCLIDADWDRKIGYEKVKELADHARAKNVGLLLWYNSAGDWNTVKYTPKDLLVNKDSRRKEFDRLKQMGIKGVKIDFFAGDGQSVMAYYHDILQDAADFHLMVNFHGATLPRGWSRTYPHLVTVEAVRGFEMVTFQQADADKQATHCTILPFTRNAFDPMDFTPMNLYKIQTQVVRRTSSAFELALPVLFVSGIQHYAESPEGMQQVPEYVKDLLRHLPGTWDEVKFINGYPGQYVVIARRSGQRWYIAGIHAGARPKTLHLDLSGFSYKHATLLTDGEMPLSFSKSILSAAREQTITLQPNGGFVLVLE